MSGKKFYEEINTLKGMAIVCVLFCHAIILYPINLLENDVWREIFKFFGSVPMPLFFLISGYCFSYKGNYGEFIGKKFLRLMLPYVVFGLVDVIPRQVLSAFVNRPSSIGESLKSMLLYGGQYWFLYTLFAVFAIYPFIYLFQKNSIVRMIIVEAVLLAVTLIETDVTVLCLNSVMQYLFFFNTGVMLKLCNIDIFAVDKIKPIPRAIVIVVLIVLWGCLSLFVPYTTVTRTVMGIIGSLSFFLLTKFRVTNWTFSRLGDYSLQLYLLNGFLLVISRTIICSITQIPIIIVAFNMLITLVCSYLFIKYFCKRVKFIRVLMGM
ncbi:MAG: acyltransferase [Lachnospiraceae bacterium]|nr:acyltransferase [Lachnospiraceae bacterium]